MSGPQVPSLAGHEIDGSNQWIGICGHSNRSGTGSIGVSLRRP
ncbi:MAG: hypothetical protein H6Q78_1101 [Candidatus Krumholzibacteriota bacterium]|nr:hypothetical protein [Candidatus Krumholzibacteriota bacterium]